MIDETERDADVDGASEAARPAPERVAALAAHRARRGGAPAQPAPEGPARVARGEPTPAQVVDLASERARRQAAPRPRAAPGWRVGGLLAAACVGVVVVAGLGQTLVRRPPDIVSARGGLVAQGDLARALQAQASGAPAARGAIRIGFSAPAAGGGFCRTFVDRGSAMSGLACRRDGAWRIDIAAAAPAITPGAPAYRLAGEEIAPSVLAAAQKAAAGAALDAAQEAQARARGWR